MKAENTLFLRKLNGIEDVYYAVSKDKVEELEYYNAYDQYGRKIGHSDASDYHYDNPHSHFEETCLNTVAETFNIGISDAWLTDDGNEETVRIEFGEADAWPSNIEEIQAFIRKWVKENIVLTKVKGFTYWDGSNWKTVVCGAAFDEYLTHEVVKDEGLIDELKNAIEDCELRETKFGRTYYDSKNGYTVIDSQYPSESWASYIITREHQLHSDESI